MGTETTTTATTTGNSKTKRMAHSIFLVGATGSGKSSQIASLTKIKDLELAVYCPDSGSIQSYRAAGINTVETSSLNKFLELYPADKYMRVMDSWPAYESNFILREKGGKDKALSLKRWGEIVGYWRDEIISSYRQMNFVMIGNISDGATTVRTSGEDGRETKKVLPPGELVCTPALKNNGLVLAQFAPIVLPLSSGRPSGKRSWVNGNFRQLSAKFAYKGPDGQCYTMPGQSDDSPLVPVSGCSLFQLWELLAQ